MNPRMNTQAIRIGSRVEFVPTSELYHEGFRAGVVVAFRTRREHIRNQAVRFRLDPDAFETEVLANAPEVPAEVADERVPVVAIDPCLRYLLPGLELAVAPWNMVLIGDPATRCSN
jgi:hypothetical protein